MITEINIDQLSAIESCPYKVKQDSEMQELITSISEQGL